MQQEPDLLAVLLSEPAERFEPAPASHEPIVVRPRILLAPTTLDVFKPGVGAVDPKRCPLIASLQ